MTLKLASVQDEKVHVPFFHMGAYMYMYMHIISHAYITYKSTLVT